jgi:hypothetical protein
LFLIFLPYFVRLSLYVLRSRFIYRESEDVTSSTLLKNSVNLRFVSVTLSSLVDLISSRFDIIAGPHSLMLGYLFCKSFNLLAISWNSRVRLVDPILTNY